MVAVHDTAFDNIAIRPYALHPTSPPAFLVGTAYLLRGLSRVGAVQISVLDLQ